jgi:hypothetical protein
MRAWCCPYVKVALSDDGLFVRRDHPARRLFDTITEACEGNDGATPQDRDLLERAAGIAQRIVADYNEDLEIFSLASAGTRSAARTTAQARGHDRKARRRSRARQGTPAAGAPAGRRRRSTSACARR